MGDYRQGAPLLCERCEVYWHADSGFDCWNCGAADDVVVQISRLVRGSIYGNLGITERTPDIAPPGLYDGVAA